MSAMLVAIICVKFSGHQGLRRTVRWLKWQGIAMWHVLGFRRTPPVRQAHANVLAEIDPQVFGECVCKCVPSAGWKSLSGGWGVILSLTETVSL